MTLVCRPWHPETWERQRAELLAFAAARPWQPAWPGHQIEAFLDRLISGPQQLIDVWDGARRVAAAVLLDKVRNPGGHACLEFLGAEPGQDARALFSLILAEAQGRLRPEQRGIQLGRYPQQGLDQALLTELGCVFYYEMFEMRCAPGRHPGHRPEPRAERLTATGFRAYYALLERAFAANPDTSLSDYDTALAAFESDTRSRIWTIGEPGHPIAFVNLLEDDGGGEIRTLGVDPDARGRGLGGALLGHALSRLSAPVCRLSVAVQNERALRLYRQMGFQIENRSACWLKPSASAESSTGNS